MTATHIRPLQTTLGGDLYRLDPPYGPDEDLFVRVEPIAREGLYVIYPSNRLGDCITYDKLAKGATPAEALLNLGGYRIER